MILTLMSKTPSITIVDLGKQAGFSKSKVYRLTKSLRERGIIIRVGSRKAGYWRIVSK